MPEFLTGDAVDERPSLAPAGPWARRCSPRSCSASLVLPASAAAVRARLAPFPLLVRPAALRGGAAARAGRARSRRRSSASLVRARPRGLVYLLLVVPVLLIGESMARGPRHAARVRVGLRRPRRAGRRRCSSSRTRDGERSRSGPSSTSRSPQFLEEHARPAMPPDADRRVRSSRSRPLHEAMQRRVSRRPTDHRRRIIVLAQRRAAAALPARGAIRAGSTAGEFEGVRWPFVLAVAFVLAGRWPWLSPLLRPGRLQRACSSWPSSSALQGLAVVALLRAAAGRAAAPARGGAGAGAGQSVGAADPGPHRAVRHLVRFPQVGRAAGGPSRA